MAQDKTPKDEPVRDGGQADTAVKSATKGKTAPKGTAPKQLPPWRVLLHNDDKNDVVFVVQTIMELTSLDQGQAVARTIEADRTGLSLLLTTHRERAELYQEQFQSKGLTVTIEPAT